MDNRINGIYYYLRENVIGLIVFDSNDFPLKKKYDYEFYNIKLSEGLSSILSECLEYEEVIIVSNNIHRLNNLIYELKKKGYLLRKKIYVLPNISNPKWFVPDDKKILKSIIKIVKPSRTISRIIFIIFKIVAFFRILNLFHIPHILILSNDKEDYHGFLTNFLSNILSNAKDYLIYTGSLGPYQKFTAQIYDIQYNIIAYAKISSCYLSKRLLDIESKILEKLRSNDYNFFCIPQLIYYGSLSKSKYILIQTKPPKEIKLYKKKLGMLHINSLVELFKSTLRGGYDGTSYSNNLFKQFKDIKVNFEKNNRCFKIIEKFNNKISFLLGNSKITLGLSHGDFAPWNILCSKDKLFIFDWEFSEFRLPLWDVYYYIFQENFTINKLNYNRIFQCLIGGDKKYLDLIKKYIQLLIPNIYINRELFVYIFLYQLLLINVEYKLYSKLNHYSIKNETVNIINFCLKYIENWTNKE